MTDSIWIRIAEIPWWIHALCLYTFYLTYLATKPRIISLKKLFIIPSFFIVLAFFGILKLVPFNLINLLIGFGCLILGSLLGWLQFSRLRIKAIPNQNHFSFYVPGCWNIIYSVLFLLLLVYMSQYQITFNPKLILESENSHLILIFYGLCIGIFFGRLAYALRCIKVGPYHETSI